MKLTIGVFITRLKTEGNFKKIFKLLGKIKQRQ